MLNPFTFDIMQQLHLSNIQTGRESAPDAARAGRRVDPADCIGKVLVDAVEGAACGGGPNDRNPASGAPRSYAHPCLRGDRMQSGSAAGFGNGAAERSR